MGVARMVPLRWTTRPSGASLSNDKCVRVALIQKSRRATATSVMCVVSTTMSTPMNRGQNGLQAALRYDVMPGWRPIFRRAAPVPARHFGSLVGFRGTPRKSVSGRAGDSFDRTACLARSLSPLGPTTHSFEPRGFPETSKRPAIGGLRRRRFGLRGDLFRPGGDFGRVVSGPRNPVSRKRRPLSAETRFECLYCAIKPSI
jgi:hypothetical protein